MAARTATASPAVEAQFWLHRVGTGSVAEHWPAALPLVQQAVQTDRMGRQPESYRQDLAKGLMQLWLIKGEREALRGIVITAIRTRGDWTLCDLVLCAGSGLHEWLCLLPDIEEWAISQGCDGVRMPGGRLGWLRPLERHGYKFTHIVMLKELADARR